ncbi:MAG: hypothetical protein AAGA91_12945 [Pseudomonadota bacterium]
MRQPWEPGVSTTDEVESLQADVMRFLAIFGLCLAAIFSLVREAELEARVSDEQPTTASQSMALPERNSANQQVESVNTGETSQPNQSLQQAAPVSAQRFAAEKEIAAEEAAEAIESGAPLPVASAAKDIKEDSAGFSLRFASGQALQVLMARGAVVVYARTKEGFFRMNGGAGLLPADPPGSFYGMDPATLPTEFMQAADRQSELDTVEWVVTLPTSTTDSIRDLMQRYRAGVLVIDSAGRVVVSEKRN